MALAFILSTERSGSTLLSSMLSGNRNLIVPSELHLLSYETIDELKDSYPIAMNSISLAFNQVFDSNDFSKYGNSTLDIYKAIDKKLGRDKIFIDKTPRYAASQKSMDKLKALNSKYIWLIRHPMAVAQSKLELRKKQRSELKLSRKGSIKFALSVFGDFRDFLLKITGLDYWQLYRYWRKCNTRIEKLTFRSKEIDVCKVNYENLVVDTKDNLENVCKCLGVNLEAEMFFPWENIPNGVEWGVGDEKIKSKKKIDTTSLNRWEKYFFPRLISKIYQKEINNLMG